MTKVHCGNDFCRYRNENCECSKDDIFLFPKIHNLIADEEIVSINGCADFTLSDSGLDELQKALVSANPSIKIAH